MIVCLDANFSQKRRKCAESDPPLTTMDSRFVPAADVDAMERELAEKRKGPPKRRRRGTSARVADEVLDECEQSFIAAQETVTKASKNYYADTGLMALLCRHDRVLYIANMTTPGERQHYALALLRQLAKDLPQDWRLGVLYDIGCQLSRSLEKVSLLILQWETFRVLLSYLRMRVVVTLRGARRPRHVWRVSLSCVRAPMGMPDRFPSSQAERFWSDGWRRVRAVLERHPSSYRGSACLWGTDFSSVRRRADIRVVLPTLLCA